MSVEGPFARSRLRSTPTKRTHWALKLHSPYMAAAPQPFGWRSFSEVITMLFRTFLSPVAGALLALGLCSGAVAQSPYPNKPVKLMVALPAGGSADMIARVVSQKLGEQLGQSFVVENKAGGSGQIKAFSNNFPTTLRQISNPSPRWSTNPWCWW